MTKNNSYKPNLFLSTYVDRYYTLEKSNEEEFKLPPIVAGTGLELLFHKNKSLKVNGFEPSQGHIVCPRELTIFGETKEVSFLSVRFKSGAFRHFTNISFSELNNNCLSVSDIWGEIGSEVLKKTNNADSVLKKIECIEFFLTEMFTKFHQDKNDKWDDIISHLYYNYSTTTVEELSTRIDLSFRQFERNFKRQFGVTPKAFQKATRFQHTLKKILLKKESDRLNVIFDNGYFDQSHFIRDFKFFTKMTPSEYFTKDVFETHFYHSSLPKS